MLYKSQQHKILIMINFWNSSSHFSVNTSSNPCNSSQSDYLPSALWFITHNTSSQHIIVVHHPTSCSIKWWWGKKLLLLWLCWSSPNRTTKAIPLDIISWILITIDYWKSIKRPTDETWKRKREEKKPQLLKHLFIVYSSKIIKRKTWSQKPSSFKKMLKARKRNTKHKSNFKRICSMVVLVLMI